MIDGVVTAIEGVGTDITTIGTALILVAVVVLSINGLKHSSFNSFIGASGLFFLW